MNRSYTPWLLLSCLSSFLYSMEESNTALTNLSKLDISNIQTFYNKTCNTIRLITPAKNTPTNNTALNALCEIIDDIKELKKYNITENQIGFFAFSQPIPVKNALFNLTTPPYNGPAYISVICEKIRQYNENLQKNEFTSPTKEQLLSHKENQKKLTAMTNASKYRLYFTPEIIEQKKIFTAIPKTVAIEELISLFEDFYTLRCTDPDEITTTATVLYGDSDTKK